MDRHIIIAAGEGTRWNNYLGVSKHFVEIGGERLLERTVRQLNERGIRPTVVGNTPDYHVEGCCLFIPNLNPDNVDADKFLSSESLWNEDGRTIVLYGDVYFTDEAMDTIVNYKEKDWRLFGREGASEHTGCGWGECFAQSFYTEHIEKHREMLHKIRDDYKAEKIYRCGGWEHYRAMEGFDLTEHKIGDKFYEIDDFTEDFDTPEDFTNFIKNYV